MKIFKPGKQRKYRKIVIGFDIETEGTNNDFVMASLYYDTWVKEFYTKESFIKEILKKNYKNCVFTATNLMFDFFGLFFGSEAIKNFRLIERNGIIMSAKTYVYGGSLHPTRPNKSAWKIEFIDTMNYTRMSVANMGKILKINKLKKPKVFEGETHVFIEGKEINVKMPSVRLPGTVEEWEELIEYNIRDSEISKKFIDYFINAVESLGGSFKLTIASCSMSIFRNKYLNITYFPPDENILLELFKGYYGGRVEVFKRGYAKEDASHIYTQYDINSLYPSIMHDNEYPDPRCLKIKKVNSTRYIMHTEGISHVRINVPHDIKMPVLPYRQDGKLIFPVGTFEGYYTHIELRRAMLEGCIIMKVYKSMYYTRMLKPFKSFVTDLYNRRLICQKNGDPMEFAYKILLNSLYGKFGERFDKRKELQPFNHTIEQLQNIENFERNGDYIYYQVKSEPKSHCIPIWAIYTTAYARLKLYDYLKAYDPIYCDTDCIITAHNLPTSDRLGDMKIENRIKEMMIIKPKFYTLKIKGFNSIDEKTKCKGLPHILKFNTVMKQCNLISYTKFAKFRESVRKHLVPNMKIFITKKISYLDDKRVFLKDLSCDSLEKGSPLVVTI